MVVVAPLHIGSNRPANATSGRFGEASAPHTLAQRPPWSINSPRHRQRSWSLQAEPLSEIIDDLGLSQVVDEA